MHALFLQLNQELSGLRTRRELLAALADIEDNYDAFNEIDQEIADKLIAELNRRINALDDPC
jgi:uncharacterized protein YPO0396